MKVFTGRMVSLSQINFMYLVGLTSTFMIIRIGSTPIVIWLLLLFVVYTLFTKKKLDFNANKLFFAFILTCFVAAILAYLPGTDNASEPLNNLRIYLIILVFALQANFLSETNLRDFMRGLRLSCIIQLAWAYLQLLFFYLLGTDINQVVFVDLLKMVEEGSRYRFGVLVPSGLCWHPSNLIVVLIILMLLFRKWYVWGACVVISILTMNSTVYIGVLVTAVLFLGYKFVKMCRRKQAVQRSMLLCIILVVAVAVVGLVYSNAFETAINNIALVFQRIGGTATDTSAQVHMAYYRSIFKVWDISSVGTILFGYGLGRSGEPFSILYNQYTTLGAWSVESDPMNLLYGSGIIGFVLFYFWMFVNLWKARNVDFKYVIFLVSILLCGITYNVQYTWVLILEIIFFAGVEKGINLFQMKEWAEVQTGDELTANAKVFHSV